MVKKNKETILSYLKNFYDSSVFSQEVSRKKASIYFLVYILIIGIFSSLRNSINPVGSFGAINSFLSAGLVTLLIILLIHTLIYVIINSYEINKKKFLDGFLVFGLITLPFVVIGHIINFIILSTYSSFIMNSLSLFLVVLGIYLVIRIIINLKVYYNISGYRAFMALFIVFLASIIFTVLSYLTYLISALN